MALEWLNPEPDFTLCMAEDTRVGSIWYLPRPILPQEKPAYGEAYGVFHRFLKAYGGDHMGSWIKVRSFEDGAPLSDAIEEVRPHYGTFLPVHGYDPTTTVYEITYLTDDYPTPGYRAEPFGFAGLITKNLPRGLYDPTQDSIDHFERRLAEGAIDVDKESGDEAALRRIAESDIQGGFDALPEYNKLRWRTFFGDK